MPATVPTPFGAWTTNVQHRFLPITTPIPVDMYMPCEFGVDGDLVTAASLQAATKGGGGVWSLAAAALTPGLALVEATDQRLVAPVKVGGQTFLDLGGTRSIKFRLDTVQNYGIWAFSGIAPSIVSVGCWVSCGTAGGSSQTLDLLQVNETAGGFFIAQVNATFQLQAHGSLFGHSVANFLLVPDKRYWLTMKARLGGLCELSLFDTLGNSLFYANGTVNTTTPWNQLRFGRCDNHAGSNPPTTSWVRFDDIVVDVTTQRFPLGPNSP